jgi:uncharacterized protein YjiS (DUF1127 family)
MLFWSFLIKRYQVWKIYRSTYAELANLDDRTLADINVGRSEIAAISRRAALRAVAA